MYKYASNAVCEDNAAIKCITLQHEKDSFLWSLTDHTKVVVLSASLTTEWTTGRLRFDPRQRRKDFSSSLCVQTGSEAHLASCTMGTGVLSLGVKRGLGVTLTTRSRLVLRLWMSRSYTSSPPCASIGVLWHCFDLLSVSLL
jgi:hypothetical protein